MGAGCSRKAARDGQEPDMTNLAKAIEDKEDKKKKKKGKDKDANGGDQPEVTDLVTKASKMGGLQSPQQPQPAGQTPETLRADSGAPDPADRVSLASHAQLAPSAHEIVRDARMAAAKAQTLTSNEFALKGPITLISLANMLDEHGVDTEDWGQGRARTIEDLHNEFTEGACFLCKGDSRLRGGSTTGGDAHAEKAPRPALWREVRIAEVRIIHKNKHGNSYILVENYCAEIDPRRQNVPRFHRVYRPPRMNIPLQFTDTDTCRMVSHNIIKEMGEWSASLSEPVVVGRMFRDEPSVSYPNLPNRYDVTVVKILSQGDMPISLVGRGTTLKPMEIAGPSGELRKHSSAGTMHRRKKSEAAFSADMELIFKHFYEWQPYDYIIGSESITRKMGKQKSGLEKQKSGLEMDKGKSKKDSKKGPVMALIEEDRSEPVNIITPETIGSGWKTVREWCDMQMVSHSGTLSPGKMAAPPDRSSEMLRGIRSAISKLAEKLHISDIRMRPTSFKGRVINREAEAQLTLFFGKEKATAKPSSVYLMEISTRENIDEVLKKYKSMTRVKGLQRVVPEVVTLATSDDEKYSVMALAFQRGGWTVDEYAAKFRVVSMHRVVLATLEQVAAEDPNTATDEKGTTKRRNALDLLPVQVSVYRIIDEIFGNVLKEASLPCHSDRVKIWQQIRDNIQLLLMEGDGRKLGWASWSEERVDNVTSMLDKFETDTSLRFKTCLNKILDVPGHMLICAAWLVPMTLAYGELRPPTIFLDIHHYLWFTSYGYTDRKEHLLNDLIMMELQLLINYADVKNKPDAGVATFVMNCLYGQECGDDLQCTVLQRDIDIVLARNSSFRGLWPILKQLRQYMNSYFICWKATSQKKMMSYNLKTQLSAIALIGLLRHMAEGSTPGPGELNIFKQEMLAIASSNCVQNLSTLMSGSQKPRERSQTSALNGDEIYRNIGRGTMDSTRFWILYHVYFRDIKRRMGAVINPITGVGMDVLADCVMNRQCTITKPFAPDISREVGLNSHSASETILSILVGSISVGHYSERRHRLNGVVLTGESHMGKTVLMYQLVNLMCMGYDISLMDSSEQAVTFGNSMLPVYISLPNLVDALDGLWDHSALRRSMKATQKWGEWEQELYEWCADQGRVIYMLDDFDRLGRNDRSNVIQMLHCMEFSPGHTGSTGVLLCSGDVGLAARLMCAGNGTIVRDLISAEGGIDKGRKVPSDLMIRLKWFYGVRIQELAADERMFLAEIGSNVAQSEYASWEASVGSHYALMSLAESPLMANLLFYVYKVSSGEWEKIVKNIPPSRFEALLAVMKLALTTALKEQQKASGRRRSVPIGTGNISSLGSPGANERTTSQTLTDVNKKLADSLPAKPSKSRNPSSASTPGTPMSEDVNYERAEEIANKSLELLTKVAHAKQVDATQYVCQFEFMQYKAERSNTSLIGVEGVLHDGDANITLSDVVSLIERNRLPLMVPVLGRPVGVDDDDDDDYYRFSHRSFQEIFCGVHMASGLTEAAHSSAGLRSFIERNIEIFTEDRHENVVRVMSCAVDRNVFRDTVIMLQSKDFIYNRADAISKMVYGRYITRVHEVALVPGALTDEHVDDDEGRKKKYSETLKGDYDSMKGTPHEIISEMLLMCSKVSTANHSLFDDKIKNAKTALSAARGHLHLDSFIMVARLLMLERFSPESGRAAILWCENIVCPKDSHSKVQWERSVDNLIAGNLDTASAVLEVYAMALNRNVQYEAAVKTFRKIDAAVRPANVSVDTAPMKYMRILRKFARLLATNRYTHEEALEFLDFITDFDIHRRQQYSWEHAELLMLKAEVLQDLAKFDDANVALQNVSNIAYSLFGEKHPAYGLALMATGKMHFATGRLYSYAVSSYTSALEVFEETVGSGHYYYTRAMLLLGQTQAVMEDHNKALNTFQNALETIQRSPSGGVFEYFKALNALGEFHRSKGEVSEAIITVEQSLQHQENFLGKAHADYNLTLANLAYCNAADGSYEEAESQFKTAISGIMKTLGAHHHLNIDTVGYLASLYETNDRLDSAAIWYGKMVRYKAEILGGQHPDVHAQLEELEAMFKGKKKAALLDKMYAEIDKQEGAEVSSGNKMRRLSSTERLTSSLSGSGGKLTPVPQAGEDDDELQPLTAMRVLSTNGRSSPVPIAAGNRDSPGGEEDDTRKSSDASSVMGKILWSKMRNSLGNAVDHIKKNSLNEGQADGGRDRSESASTTASEKRSGQALWKVTKMNLTKLKADRPAPLMKKDDEGDSEERSSQEGEEDDDGGSKLASLQKKFEMLQALNNAGLSEDQTTAKLKKKLQKMMIAELGGGKEDEEKEKRRRERKERHERERQEKERKREEHQQRKKERLERAKNGGVSRETTVGKSPQASAGTVEKDEPRMSRMKVKQLGDTTRRSSDSGKPVPPRSTSPSPDRRRPAPGIRGASPAPEESRMKARRGGHKKSMSYDASSGGPDLVAAALALNKEFHGTTASKPAKLRRLSSRENLPSLHLRRMGSVNKGSPSHDTAGRMSGAFGFIPSRKRSLSEVQASRNSEDLSRKDDAYLSDTDEFFETLSLPARLDDIIDDDGEASIDHVMPRRVSNYP